MKRPRPVQYFRERRERKKAAQIAEIIGRVQRTYNLNWRWPTSSPSRDATRVDYKFWDKARRGKAQGLEVSGLLIKPVCSKIAAWALGEAPIFTMDSEPGQVAINDWWHENHADLLRGYEDSLGLGDVYLVINGDLSVTIVPPDVVEPIVADDDYSQVVGWVIRQRWPHPNKPGDTMTIEDVYTVDERIHRTLKNGAVISEERFPNLIGILPVVHVPNNVGINQAYGVPEVEALVVMLQEYGAILESGLFGNKKQGRPTPTVNFKDADALTAFWEQYATVETKELEDGTTETYETIPFTSDNFMAVIGDLKYAQPGPFVGETKILLELLYLLYLEHTELPEFVLGSAISSSRASAETQMPVFERFIRKKQGQAENWILQVVNIVQSYMSLGIEPGVVVEDVDIVWPPLVGMDAKLTLEAAKVAKAEGVLDNETFLQVIPLEIKNPVDVLAKAREEQDERARAGLEDELAAVRARLIDNEESEDDFT